MDQSVSHYLKQALKTMNLLKNKPLYYCFFILSKLKDLIDD